MGATMYTMPKDSELNDPTGLFAAVMKFHHRAAIDMARVLLQTARIVNSACMLNS